MWLCCWHDTHFASSSAWREWSRCLRRRPMYKRWWNLRSSSIVSPLEIVFYAFWTKNELEETCVVGLIRVQWCSFGFLFAGRFSRALGSGPFSLLFFSRKTSSWPHVWNYTPGSEQGRLAEKKTAVTQWITVLWPDKCSSEEGMRKLGSASRITRSETPALSTERIHTVCLAGHEVPRTQRSKNKGGGSQTVQICCSFSGEGSKRFPTARSGSSAASQCKQCTSSDWPPWTEPAAPQGEPADLNAASVSHRTVSDWGSAA